MRLASAQDCAKRDVTAAGALGSPEASVSVVIPVRDGELYLEEAIRSVLEQSPPPLEVIVVDDGSTDRSAEVAGRAGSRVRTLVRSPGGSAPAARNAGVAAARGEILAFLDADDTWRPDRLARQLPELARADLVFGHVEEFHSPELPPERRERLPGPRGVVPGRVITTMLVRLDAFRRVGPFDERLQAADFLDWLARARAAGLTEHMVDQVVAGRRIHERNTQWVSRPHDVLAALRSAVTRGRT